METLHKLARALGVVTVGSTSRWPPIRTGDADRARDILSGLRRSSPRWLRYQQLARDTTREILAKRPRMPNEEQRALASFMNVEG